jgi:autotransporter-associated beta strand protein
MKSTRLFIFPLLANMAAAQIPAFPGAEGYGAYANGGRGGDVYHVTNLNASGAGSFADAIATVPTAGRTIVFDVSGYIRLPSGSNGTRMTTSKVTIAGQTAPGDGVGFYNNFFRISGDDIVVRHLRFRHGKYGSGGDCIDLDSGSQNTILDSLSLQFSTDENISSFGSPPENLTMQWSLNGWGLESHSCGGLWDQNHASSHHSLWAHNHTRNPKARPNGLLEWVNNVTFDWDIGFIMGDSPSNASWKANVRGDYFLCPPGNLRSKALEKASLQTSNGLPNFSLYLDNCLHDADGDGQLNGTDKGYAIASGSYNTSATPFAGSTAAVTIDPPLLAFKKVLSKAGAQRLDVSYAGDVHDEVDARMVSNVLTQTANHITRESDLAGVTNAGFGMLNSTPAAVDTDKDGMPDFYETALGWAPATQDHNTALANSGGIITGTTFFPTGTVAGYTRLEEYLHFLAIPHGTLAKNIAGTPTSIQVDLRKYTKGFVKSPVFTLTNVLNGTTAQSGTGNYLITFTPTLNYVGRAKFDFTVTDSDGSAWTQTCALLVSSSGLPRDLSWKGDSSANIWDDTANNWLRNGTATAFSFGDRVTFDDSGSKTPAVNVTGTVSPTTVDVNATGNYTIGGTGAVSASGMLTKRGSGTLTINNTGTNSFSGATLSEGTITLGIEAANNTGLGAGSLTMNGGTLNMYNTGPGGSFTGTLPNPLVINGNVAFNAAARCGTSGALSGAGTLNLYVPYIRTDWGGNPVAFTGRLNVTTDADGCEFRINNGGTGAVTDYGNARIWLADKVNAYFLPNPPSTGDKTQTVQVGELATTGTGAGVYLGGASGAGDRFVNWKVGALNTSTTFGGVIQNRTGPAALTKVGSGTLTLTGASTHTGATNVNVGALLVDGSLGNTPVTVAGGALLGGDGSIGGTVTASSGAFLSPGTVPFTGATMTVGGLALNGNTLYFDMSNSSAGANDKIAVNGGALAMTGTQYFQFLLLQNTLAAGTYDLITGASSISASGYTLTHNLPTGTRQTFDLAAVGNIVRLTVTGDPATLTWTGATSANWDTSTANNWTGATPNTFGSNDAVIIDDSSAVTNIALPAPVTPRSTLVNNTTRAFTIAGGINGGSLTKSGTNTLTLGGANTFGGGLTLNAGTIYLANEDANNAGLGTGTVMMNGGIISMRDDSGTYNNFNARLVVPAGATARLNADSRVDMYGTLSGAGTLNFYVPFTRTKLFTDWSAFTGTINVLTDSSGGDFFMASNYSFAGFPQAAVVLSDKVWAYYDGILTSGAGTTIEFGELSGTALSVLQGGETGGRALTYRIGGKNTNATFAGTISEQNTGTATSYIKTGAGTWTLSGTGAWNGGTTVEQGTLKITGSFSCLSAANVQSGASFLLSGGSLATDSVNIDGGATMTAYGTLSADLNVNGALETRGFSSGTPGTLAVNGGVFLGSSSLTHMRGGVSSDLIAVTGDVSLGGTLQVSLAAGTTFGRYPLVTCGGALTGSAALTGIPGGTSAHLSSSVAGRLDLVIDDSDEDGLPDSWETLYLGGLGSGPADDNDGDGQSNATEYLAGTNPKNGASFFAATIVPASGNQFTLTWPSVPGKTYAIETSADLAGSWARLISLPAASSPATSTDYTVTNIVGSMFYRVAIVP